MAAVDVTLRAVTSRDSATLAALHTTSWQSAYRGILRDAYLDGPVIHERQATWQARLTAEAAPGVGWIAQHEAMPIGFVYAYLSHDATWGTLIDNLHVLPAARGRGIGWRLMQQVARAMPVHDPALHLWVFEQNLVARAFYERVGGQVVEAAHKPAPDGGHYPELRMAWTGAALDALRAG